MCIGMCSIGNVYQSQGKYPEVLEMQQKCLEIEEKIYGHNHPSVANTLYNIGGVYESQELFELAAESFEKCVPIYSSVHGTDHAGTIDAQSRAESARRHAELRE